MNRQSTTHYFNIHKIIHRMISISHHPCSRVFQHLEQLPFVAVRIGAKIAAILPPRELRQAHQDTLNTRIRCIEAKLGAAVMYEIELDIAAAAEELPAALRIRAGRVCATLQYGKV